MSLLSCCSTLLLSQQTNLTNYHMAPFRGNKQTYQCHIWFIAHEQCYNKEITDQTEMSLLFVKFQGSLVSVILSRALGRSDRARGVVFLATLSLATKFIVNSINASIIVIGDVCRRFSYTALFFQGWVILLMDKVNGFPLKALLQASFTSSHTRSYQLFFPMLCIQHSHSDQCIGNPRTLWPGDLLHLWQLFLLMLVDDYWCLVSVCVYIHTCRPAKCWPLSDVTVHTYSFYIQSVAKNIQSVPRVAMATVAVEFLGPLITASNRGAISSK